MAVRGDQLHRQVGAQEELDQAQEGEGDEHAPARPRRGRTLRASPSPAGRSAATAEDELEQRQRRRQPERGEAGFGDHRTRSASCARASSVELGRHVILVMLGEDLVGDEQPVRLELPFGDDAAILPEQIGRDAAEADPDRARRLVADDEVDRHAVRAMRIEPFLTMPPIRTALPTGRRLAGESPGA